MIEYFPILLFAVISLMLGASFMLTGIILSRKCYKNTRISRKPYECGFPALTENRKPFNVRFYVFAVMFVIFDAEMVLLFPWAMLLKAMKEEILWGGLAFFSILVAGFIYEWVNGLLEWY